MTACAFAAHAPAAPAPTLFEVSITGTSSQQWTYKAAPVVSGECTRVQTSEGIRSVQFRTAAPLLVRMLAGRVLTADVRTIGGTVTLAGANTIDENCGGVGTGRIEDCVQSKRSFTGARARLSSRQAGFIDLGPVRNVRLRLADCPREPVEVRQRPLGPPLRMLRLPRESLNERRLTRMTVRASASRRTSYAAPGAGTLLERVEWRLTFVRVTP